MARAKPSHAEVEILQSLWDRGQATVREVYTDIQAHRSVGYTTTLKQMQRMLEKDLIEKVGAEGRSHTYRAKVKPQRTRSALLDRLITTAFDGSSNALILHALGRERPSKSEIAEIRALLDALEQDETTE
ncbi:MAG: BlaI/MecI/CopY family transcriptional regulator [Myxococcota bacterium]